MHTTAFNKAIDIDGVLISVRLFDEYKEQFLWK